MHRLSPLNREACHVGLSLKYEALFKHVIPIVANREFHFYKAEDEEAKSQGVCPTDSLSE